MPDNVDVPIQAVVFDIGGVLEVNPITGWRERWAARLQIEPSEFKRVLDRIWSPGSVGATTLERIESETRRALGLDQAQLAALMRDAWTEYLGTLNHEVAEYFCRLRPRYKTGILSNSFVGAREREQEAYGFEDMCDVIVYSHEEGCMKPDAASYLLVCERLDVPPEDTIFLDDVAENVNGASAVGMRAIMFSTHSQAFAALQTQMAP